MSLQLLQPHVPFADPVVTSTTVLIGKSSVQFNKDGATLAGDDDFTYDPTKKELAVANLRVDDIPFSTTSLKGKYSHTFHFSGLVSDQSKSVPFYTSYNARVRSLVVILQDAPSEGLQFSLEKFSGNGLFTSTSSVQAIGGFIDAFSVLTDVFSSAPEDILIEAGTAIICSFVGNCHGAGDVSVVMGYDLDYTEDTDL